MSPIRKPRPDLLRHSQNSRTKEAPKSGISPSFIFLQLYHAAHFKNPTEKPLLIDSNDIVQRALTVLDFIPPYETHKIGKSIFFSCIYFVQVKLLPITFETEPPRQLK